MRDEHARLLRRRARLRRARAGVNQAVVVGELGHAHRLQRLLGTPEVGEHGRVLQRGRRLRQPLVVGDL